MMNKEKWVEEVLSSSHWLQPAEANPFMATRIEALLRKDKPAATPPRLASRWVYLSAALMVALIVANVLAWRKPVPSIHAGIESVMQEYGWSGQSAYSVNF